MAPTKQPLNGWTKRIMDAIPLLLLGLVSWICISIVQLKISVAEMGKDVSALLTAKEVGSSSSIKNNEQRLDELEEAQDGIPTVAAPVTVVNPPSEPVPVKPAEE